MKTIHIAAAYIMFVAYSCGPAASEKYSQEKAMADSVSANGFFSSSAAIQNKKDSVRKFIRTADLKFKVGNVQRSTYIIEDIVGRHNGFVTLSNLASTINHKSTVKVSEDSLLETTYYVTENTMSMRVPNTELDTVLKEIAKQTTFLDYRVIKAEDVSLQLMANKWTQKRAEKHYARLEKAIDEKAKKLKETTEAEENLATKEELGDYSKMENFSIIDQVNYSTINLLVYQREVIKKELIENEKNIREYEPNLFSKIKDSLRDGWLFLEGFMLFLLKLWPLIPIVLVLWIILKKHYRKK
jgi:hypothetical protein